jgi:hypothetical protein
LVVFAGQGFALQEEGSYTVRASVNDQDLRVVAVVPALSPASRGATQTGEQARAAPADDLEKARSIECNV